MNQPGSKLNNDAEATPTPTSTNGVGDGHLQLLQKFFLCPCLSVLEIYLSRKNGNRKTLPNCVYEFSQAHSKVFRLFFVTDLLLFFFVLWVVALLVIRGLGLEEYITCFASANT